MPDLPRISAVDTVSLPTSSLPELFIALMHVECPEQDKNRQALRLVFQRYNFDEDFVSWNPEHRVKLNVDNIRAEAARVPMFGQAMGTVCVVGGLMVKERQLRVAYQVALKSGTDEVKASALAALNAVETSLGMKLTEAPVVPPPPAG